MAFRSQTAAFAFLILAQAAAAQEFVYEARHDHLRKGGLGTLAIDGKGVRFAEARGKHHWSWAWQDIQQFEIAPTVLRVLTYRDNAWKLGADREVRFDLRSGKTFTEAYEFLKDKLDQRLVAALPDAAGTPEFRIPVKHLRRFGGTEGVLVAGGDRVVFQTDRKNESRTWRIADIENISRTGPFDLTLTTYERAKTHYGNLKGFNFQLKEPLSEARFNELWREINRAKGLQFLTSYDERKTNR